MSGAEAAVYIGMGANILTTITATVIVARSWGKMEARLNGLPERVRDSELDIVRIKTTLRMDSEVRL